MEDQIAQLYAAAKSLHNLTNGILSDAAHVKEVGEVPDINRDGILGHLALITTRMTRIREALHKEKSDD